MVKEFEKKNEIATVKHFPGHPGNSDSHKTIIYDRRSLKTLKENEFITFQAGIDAGVSMIMVAHTIQTLMDEKWPASLSPKVHDYLREEMGFNGVIVTDSITMAAPQKWVGSNGEVAVQAVLAGNDLLCTSSPVGEYEAVVKAVKSGRIKKSRINQSVRRILKLKLEKGIIK